MKCVWQTSAKVLVGFLAAAMYATPQTSTISARPGAVNYIEGAVYIDGQQVSAKTLGQTFLDQNQTLGTENGKAEVLLTPGVFMRIGSNSEIRMISPSLINTQVQLDRGEAMIEVAQLVKGNNIQILDHGGFVKFEKTGLYRVTADQQPLAAVIDGTAMVSFGDQTVKLGKGHQTVIAQNLKAEKFDRKQEDELYAWSNVRASYDAEASYSAARRIEGYGYGPGYGSGWFWNTGWNSWAWLPGAGYAYSPFGWGFYGPGYLGYAPFGYAPYRSAYVVRRGGPAYWSHNNGTWVGHPAAAHISASRASGGRGR